MKLIKELLKNEAFKDLKMVAAKDAELKQDHADDFFVMTNGLCPAINREESLRHDLWIEGADTTRLKQWRAQLEAIEDELVKHLPTWMLLAFLVIVGITEFESAIIFWKARGVLGFPRIVVAVATAITTVFFPWILTDLVNRLKQELPSANSKIIGIKE